MRHVLKIMGVFALCITLVCIASPVFADSITVQGEALEGVYVTETDALIFIRFPDTGEVKSYNLNDVEVNSIRKSSDREQLREIWRKNANINPRELLENRDPEYRSVQADDASEESQNRAQLPVNDNYVTREEREKGILERERVINSNGVPTLTLKGNKKADPEIDAGIQLLYQQIMLEQLQQQQAMEAYQQQMLEAQQRAEQEMMEAEYAEYLRSLDIDRQQLMLQEQALRVDSQAMQNEWMRRFGYNPYYTTPYVWPRVPVYIQPGSGGVTPESAENTSSAQTPSYNNHGGNYVSNFGNRQNMDRLTIPDNKSTYPWAQNTTRSSGNNNQSSPRNVYPWSMPSSEPEADAEK